MFKWTKESVIEESKKYKTRTEFSKKKSAAYKFARINGLLDEMSWLIKPKPTRSEINDYCVYGYIDEVNKVAYIGLTHCPRKRHNEHFSNCNGDSSVFKYFNSISQNVPNPIYIVKDLYWDEALTAEDKYVNVYKEKGYLLLNKAKTGKKSGSLGGNVVKWDKTNVFNESKKYSSKTELYKKNLTVYHIIYKNNWFKDMPWLNSNRKPHKFWSKEKVVEIAKKYTTLISFMKENNGAYTAATRGGYLNELTWLERTKYPKGYWTEEKLIEESKKYNSKKEFRENNRDAYRQVSKELFKKMVWLKEKWTEEKIYQIASSCHSKKEFYRNHLAAYKASIRKNIYNNIIKINNW